MISTVIFASLAVYSWKILGFLIPDRLIGERGKLIAERMTVSLLAALVVLQGFSSQSALVLDARAARLGCGGGSLGDEGSLYFRRASRGGCCGGGKVFRVLDSLCLVTTTIQAYPIHFL